jgi:serine/threonine-protein kinase
VTAAADHARALREVGRALAFDPTNQAAIRTLVELLTSPPSELPAEAEGTWRDRQRDARKRSVQFGALLYATFIVLSPLGLWMGLRDWRIFALTVTLAVATVGAALATGRLWPASTRGLFPVVILSVATIGTMSCVFGPLILVPSVLALNALAVALHGKRRFRIQSAVIHALAVIVPLLLALVGVLPPWYAFEGGRMSVLPHLHPLSAVPATVTLTLASLVIIVLGTAYAGRYRDALREAERRLHVQAWQLRQLAPEAARS